MSHGKIFIFIILSETLLVMFLPHALTVGRKTVPFPFLRVEYSYTVIFLGYSLRGQFELSTNDIINKTYIEVVERLMMAGAASASITFYVSLINRSIILVEELLPTLEIPPHGEYFDLWIGEGHNPGDAVKILNQTVTLSDSGLRCYGWLFFYTLMANSIEFSCSRDISLYGSIISANYYGRLEIIYDRETGLMLEDRQYWTVNYVESGYPRTLSYSIVFTYNTSNVRFTYVTYALTTFIYSVLILVGAMLVYFAIHVYRKRKAEKLALEKPPISEEHPKFTPPPEGSPSQPLTPPNGWLIRTIILNVGKG
ncbi:MAG: hypothetical protein QXQ64_02045 [Candidatus Bathyarchaeia archaeon]